MSEDSPTTDEKLDRILKALAEQQGLLEAIARNQLSVGDGVTKISAGLTAVLEQSSERRGVRKVPRRGSSPT